MQLEVFSDLSHYFRRDNKIFVRKVQILKKSSKEPCLSILDKFCLNSFEGSGFLSLMLLLVFSYRNDLANLLFGSSSKVWGAKDCQLGEK